MTYTVRLVDLKYVSTHGLYPQEALTGNEFLVNLEVTLQKQLQYENNISDLTDYVFLKEVVDTYMKGQYPLLEDIVARIESDIKKRYYSASGKVTIAKLQPPFGGRCGRSEVEYCF